MHPLGILVEQVAQIRCRVVRGCDGQQHGWNYTGDPRRRLWLSLVDASDLAPKTKKYYHNGWRLLEGQKISSMLVSYVSEDAISLLRLPGGNSNANNALRTL